MRIAIITETFLPKMDGIVRVICLTVDHLQSKGHEVLIIAPNLSDTTPVEDYNGSKVVTIEGIPFPPYPELRLSPPSPTIYRVLQDFKPDIAHFFHPITLGIPALAMAKALNIATLISYHLDCGRFIQNLKYGPIKLGWFEGFVDILTRVVFNWGDYTLAPSKQAQQQMWDLGIDDVGLWKRGVDAERFSPNFYSDAMRETMSDGNPDDVLLLYVGRLSYEKHLENLRPVLDNLPNTRLVLVGDGPFRSGLEKIFEGTKTNFMGYVRGEALSQVYASSDIFVFPSSMETFGLVVVEAMAAGLPIVASQVGGIPDLVEEGKTGYTFPIGDIAGLQAGIEKISRERETMKAMGKAARAFAETQSWGHMMDEVIEHYERILAERAEASEKSA